MPHDGSHISKSISQQNCSKKQKDLQGIPYNLIGDTSLNNLLVKELQDINFPKSSNISSTQFSKPKHGIGKKV
tara:strand:+ start:1009 stop:1227 length:219 start_codon:yes stop_codon:yes gene_type:complete